MASGTVRFYRVVRTKPERVYRAFLDPDAIALDGGYLGWQESLVLLARLGEAEIPD